MVSLTNHSVKQASYMPLMLVNACERPVPWRWYYVSQIHSNIPLMWRWIQRSFHMKVNPCAYKVHFHARRMLYNIKMVLQSKLPTTTTKPKANYTTCLGVILWLNLSAYKRNHHINLIKKKLGASIIMWHLNK